MATDRGTALALSASAGILAAAGGCAATSAGPSGPQPMPEYPPLADTADGGAPVKAARPEPTTTSVAGSTSRGAVRLRSKDCCKGRNECKGKGGCKTANNACKGQNQCKGQGGCKVLDCD
jgi:hypothetical protein